MRARVTISVITLCLLLVGTVFAQKTAIKVEGMSIHRLHEMNLPNPNSWDNVTSNLTSVGTGTLVWLSGWDVTGDTTYKPAASYLWTLTAKPGGSATVLDSTNKQWTTFRPDMDGNYTVRLTINAKDTTVTINAAKFTGTNRSGVAGAPFNCQSCHASATPTVYTKWAGSGHARKFEKGMIGENGSYWGASCFKCHTTGYNAAATAVNGGFDDVQTTLGFNPANWTPWRAGLYDSLLTTDKKMLTLVAGITCENCHGPKNPAHFGLGTQPKTMNPQVCATCHDEPWRHNRYVQWQNSGHAAPVWSNSFRSSGSTPVTSFTLSACVRCHDGGGFTAFTKSSSFDNRTSTGYGRLTQNAIVCQSCHDPHSMDLRTGPATADTLANAFNYSSVNMGKGKVCANCHKFRRDGEVYPVTTSMSSNWGPHYAGATDLFLGKNGSQFGATLPSSIAHKLIDNTCVGCHMSATPDTGSVARDQLGMHTWNMNYTPPGGQSYDNVTGCLSCHTGITKFKDIIAAFDYDGDGITEPFFDEVEGLKSRIAMALPPVGLDSINRTQLAASSDSVKFKKAFWNYLLVKYGGGHGAHNPKYTIALLQNSVTQLTGVEFSQNEGVPTEFALKQNYPNPFNPSTTIQFSIPRSGHVRLQVFDIAGRLVTTLLNEEMAAGNFQATWDGKHANGTTVASGVYLYRLTADNASMTKKMVLLK